MEEQKKNNSTSEDEIDLIEVALKIWAERKFILKVVAVFFVLGLVVAFGSKKEYKAETTFILEDNNGGSRTSGLIAQFGGLAGINIGDNKSSDILSPELFPNIIHSTSFLARLVQNEVYFDKLDKKLKISEYLYREDRKPIISYFKDYTIYLPRKIISLFKEKKTEKLLFQEDLMIKLEDNNKIVRLSAAEQAIVNKIRKRLEISLDEKTGILSITTEMPDPIACAEITKVAFKNLTNYLIDYKTEKAINDLQFIEKQFEKSKKRFQNAQFLLAKFRDQNLNVITAKAKTEEQRLQADYDLTYSIYEGLAQQLETAKIDVQEDTPIFRLVENVKIPLRPYKPKKAVIILIITAIGGLVAIGFLTLKIIWLDNILNHKTLNNVK